MHYAWISTAFLAAAKQALVTVRPRLVPGAPVQSQLEIYSGNLAKQKQSCEILLSGIELQT